MNPNMKKFCLAKPTGPLLLHEASAACAPELVLAQRSQMLCRAGLCTFTFAGIIRPTRLT